MKWLGLALLALFFKFMWGIRSESYYKEDEQEKQTNKKGGNYCLKYSK